MYRIQGFQIASRSLEKPNQSFVLAFDTDPPRQFRPWLTEQHRSVREEADEARATVACRSRNLFSLDKSQARHIATDGQST